MIDDKKRGLVAQIASEASPESDQVSHVLGQFTNPWEWAD